MKKKIISFIGLFVLGLCVISINGECKPGSVPCRIGKPECVTVKQQNDGRIDCKDGSDEDCKEGWFICKDKKSCVDSSNVQDGVPDCADASDEECGPLQHRCVCAPHRCIDAENLKDGIKDCEDGSDEVEEIDIKSDCPKLVNSKNPVVRSKRRATDVSTRVDGPVTTSMFLGADSTAIDSGIRTRPTGLLTSTVGTFIQQGTTTEFATKVFGTHVDGHYAKIISTSSRVFFAIPSPAAGDALGGVRPTGLISSVTATRVSGLATTLHTTDYYRTYIDGTYAQLVSSYSRVVYPSTHTILATNAYNSIQSGQIYQTALNVLNDAERHIIDVSPINSKPIDKIIASKASTLIKPTGSYKQAEHVSVVTGDTKVTPGAIHEDVVTITGTHAAFVNSPAGNAETTYNVFTGTYVRDSKTYHFFFGNSANQYSPSSVNVVHATSIPEPQELIIKSGSIPGKRIVVNVDRELNLVVPKQAASHAVAGTGEIEGQDLGGVFIEASDDLSGFSVHGAQRSRNNVATEMLTVTIGKNVAHTKILRDHSLQPTAVKSNDKTVFKFLPLKDRLRQSSSSRVTSSTSHHVEEENENLLKARKIDYLRPSKPKINLPTYTVGHVDYEHGIPSSHEETTEVTVSVNKSVETFIGNRPRKDFKFLSTSNRPRPGKSFRNFQIIHDKEDLQHVESQQATVTYVGFADFTTTVGNTVIVFMPHTKSSQQPKSISPNLKVTKLSDAILPTVSSPHQPESTRMMTKIKTYFSNSPGMVTKTVTGHTLKMQTSLPTMLVVPTRKEKVFNVNLSANEKASDYEDMRSKVLAEEQVEASHVIDADLSSELQLSSIDIEPSVTFDEGYSEIIASSAEAEIHSSIALENVKSEIAETSSVIPTPQLTFATTETKLYKTDTQFPIGLVKSVGGTEAYNGTTTIFTSLFYGTRIEGKYAQIIQTTSSIYFKDNIDPTKISDLPVTEVTVTTEESIHSTTESSTDTTTEGTTVELFGTTVADSSAENELVNEVDLGRKVNSNPNDQVIEDNPTMSSILAKGAPQVPAEETSTIQYVTKVIPNTVYKTYTYFTTFFIPDGEETSTSVQSREVTSSEISLSTSLVDIREILATAVANLPQPSTTPQSIETETTEETTITTNNITPETSPNDVTINEIVTFPTTPIPDSEQEEIELIFKTQYTTYTYLTTYFHDKSSSVSSREEVVTNIITSTLDPGSIASDPAVAGLFAREDSIVSAPLDIMPTSVGVGRPTTKFFSEMDESAIKPTARLAPSNTESFTILDQPENGVKTYYTTYTYFTTIFVDGETTVSSRTEVYTNVITPTGILNTPTQDLIATTLLPEKTILSLVKDEEVIATKTAKAIESGNYANKYSTAIRQKLQHSNLDDSNDITTPKNAITTPDLLTASSNTQTMAEISEVTTEASTAETSTESSNHILVTQEIPSGPTGPSGLEDQISLESNTDIDPSPTLLLQTSYTTFTYFTTLYKGTTSDIISRLETITNVATETVTPVSASLLPIASIENNELDATSVQELYPITYFTTFTYWTTAYKDGSTVVTSREETVSNVVTPTAEISDSSKSSSAVIEPSSIVVTPTPVLELQPTTFYTTFTYFTTSYIGDSTVINSRLETVTNIATNTLEDNTVQPAQTGRAIGTVAPSKQLIEPSSQVPIASPVLLPTGLISTIRSTTVNDGTTTLLSTDVYGTYIDGLYAKVLESSTQVLTEVTPSPSVAVQPTGIVSLNIGSIVDVEGITTTYYTTKAIGTYIGNLYAQVVESTTSLYVDPERTPEPAVPSRTGLVRLIEGSIEKDGVTTMYESRVIGTVVDGKYAQIIESTSNYHTAISPTNTVSGIIAETHLVSGIVPVLESSLGDTTGSDDDQLEEHEEDDELEEDDEDDSASSGGKGRVKSRLTFQSRKRTFTPVIRPFASRNRPTFNPRRRQTSATTITRTTLTPTVTATPASVSGGETTPFSRGRFNNRRVTGSSSAIQSNNAEVRPTSARKFSRGRSSSTAGFAPSSSSSGFSSISGRRSSSGRISPTQASAYPFGSSSRRGGSFSGRNAFSTPGRGSSIHDNHSTKGSSTLSGSSRFRIRPTSSLSYLGRATSALTPSTPDLNDNVLRDIDNDVTEIRTEQEGQNTDFTDTTINENPTTVTEATNFKRPPPFKLRRPPIPTRAPTTSTTGSPRTTSAARRFSLRRPTASRISDDDKSDERKTERPKFRASTTTPVPARARVTRPNGAQTLRQRPTSNLFPPRGLFRRPGDEEDKAEDVSKTEEDKLVDDQNHDDKPAHEEEIGDNDYEASEPVEKSVHKKESPKIQIRPFQSRLLRRSRRQTEYGNRGGSPSRTLASRLRRPTPTRRTSVVEEDIEEYETEEITPAPKYSPIRSRNQQTQSSPRVRPTATSPRSQFTLTNSNSRTTQSTNKRPSTNTPSTSRRRRPETVTSRTTISQRPKPPRLRSQNSETTTNRGSSNRRFNTATTNRGRTTSSRGRYRDFDYADVPYSQSTFDGTITVTHKVPTEVTIPVVNGKITEYKQVIRNTPSTEVLRPDQYSSTEISGSAVLIINTEITATPTPGITEVTQFILRETPTTSVTFTPTNIRGRKTSFSHIVPSTVYEVENVVNTISDSLNPSAPLANLLLSQLLLGNFGLQQNINPLLALNQQAAPATPVTEYKTRSTTYVTTVTDLKSTVLPLTLRGKAITTTIIESSVDVITATEYITDTIVVTPTQSPNNQINSLLLPALLQAQLAGQQQQTQNSNPLLQLQQAQQLQQLQQQQQLIGNKSVQKNKAINKETFDEDLEDTYHEEDPRSTRDSDFDVISKEEISQHHTKTQPTARKKQKIQPIAPKPKETSIITLYVSGRNPGEFSTVLSTVISDGGASLVKREAITPATIDYKPSAYQKINLPEEDIDLYIMSAINDIEGSELGSSSQETQSLESILGDVTKHIDQSITISKNDISPAASVSTNVQTGHFLSQGSVELAPLKRKARETHNRGNVDALTSVIDEKITPRKRIRIRVPIRKTKSEDLTLAEAQHPGFSSNKKPNEFEFLAKKQFDSTNISPMLVEISNSTLHRKRVIVTRRKKITDIEVQSTEYKPKDLTTLNASSSRKLKVVTHKRALSTTSIKSTATRQRIVVTKKRPINKSSLLVVSTDLKSSTLNIASNEAIKHTDSASFKESIYPSATIELKPSSDIEIIKSPQSIEISKLNLEDITIKPKNNIANRKKEISIISEINEPEHSFKTPLIEPSLQISFMTESNKSYEHATPTLSETYVEETTYDGPKFVRPTRFSVTHKPSDAFLKRIQSLRTKGKSVLPTRSYNRNKNTHSSTTVTGTENTYIRTSISSDILYGSKSLEKRNSDTLETTHTQSISDTKNEARSTKVEIYTLKTEIQTKFKTFTYIITRVNGEEQLVTTTHEVKPVLTTVTLTDTLHPSSASAIVISTPVVSFGETINKDDSSGRGISGRIKFEEGRMNLATRIMSNGVEVIVADRSTLANENLRIAPSSQRPLMAPSTLSDQMLSMLPENNPQGSLIASLRSKTAQFITKSNPTTFTYLTTLTKGRNTITSSREEVIYNRVTEPPREEFITPTKTIDHFTITSNYDKAKYETGTFHTTYTYLNTILDGEVPVVVTSKETISNTVTGHLATNQLQPSEPVFDTNTYYNTFTFTKSLNDESGSKFTSKHRNIVTQVVITEAPTFALKPSSSIKQMLRPTATTDIIKTYFVTYTYFSTFLEKGSTVIKTNIATSSDVVTEKFYLSPKRTPIPENTKISAEIDIAPTSYEPLNVFATKTYLTTFTYFTTLLQGKNTVTSSSTKLVYNVVTEAITSGLDSLYLDSLRSSFAAQTLREPITTTVMLAGEELEITAIQPTASSGNILNTASSNLSPSFEHVVTGSTIIFLEDETTTATNAYSTATTEPEVAQVFTDASTVYYSEQKNKNNTDTPEFLLSSLESNPATSKSEFLTSTISASTVIKNSNGPATTLLPGDKVVLLTRPDGNVTMIPVSDPVKKRPPNQDDEDDEDEDDDSEDGDLKVPSLTGSDGSIAAEIGVSDLLNFGQLGINGLNALGPVINAMAGLIQSNLNTGQVKRNITQVQIRKPSTPFPEYIQPKTPNNKQQISAQREPVYIPVGSLANNAHLTSEKHVPGFSESVRPDLPEDNENAGSSWVDSLPLQGVVGERIPLMDRPPQSQIVLGRPTMESPLLQDGIPIQPGQVITANSDVIVGKPSVLGPRPRPTNQVLPPNDLRQQQVRPNEGVHHQHNINDIHPQQNQHNYPSKPNIPKVIPGKIPSPSNVPIGMRPPPLPQPHQQHQPHHIPHKSTSNAPPFLGNRFPQTHSNQASSHQHQGSHNIKPIPHPTFVQNIIERSTGTIRPSKPMIIQGASTQYFGSDGRPINNNFSNDDRSPIPLPEPGFIGVSNIGVSDQHVHHHQYDNNDGHIVVGTVGEPPAGPQHLGEVILEIPDTMPVLQPGSKLNFPISSEQENSGSNQNLEGLSQRPFNDLNHNTNLHRHPVESTHAVGQLHRPHVDSHIVQRLPFENSGRPVYRPQVDNFNIQLQQSVPVQNPIHDKNPAFSRPPFDSERNPNHPNLQQTPIDMMPPPLPNRNDPSNNLHQRPLVHYVTQHAPNNYQDKSPQQQRPHQPSGPVVIPFNQHRPTDHNARPDDVVISPVNSWDDPDEPEIQEGEEQGEVIQESNDRPLRPNEIPPEIVTERPHISDFNHDDDIVTQRPLYSRDRVTHGSHSNNNSERPSFVINRLPFKRPETNIITRKPLITINNQGSVVSERAPDIVTARPSISSNNPIFTKHEEAADTERPTFVINSDGFEFDSQANTPRPFIARPPRPPTSEKPPPLPMPDQDMNPPPPPITSASQNKNPGSSSSSKNQQRFPIIEVNLQDSTHRPTVGQRPQRPKPSSPYQYEIPERDVKPPPLPSLQRPSPFKPPPFAKDKIPDAGPSDSSIIVPQGTVESVQEERIPPRPTLRPRPARPSPRPSVRPTRPSSNLSSRPIRLPPQFVLEPPSPPPNIDLESSILIESPIQTIASIEGDNIIVRTNTFEESTIRPTKTVTVFETILTDTLQTQKYTPTRSSYKPKTRPPFRRPLPSSSNIQLESSQDVWPETINVGHTASIYDSIGTSSTKTVESTKSAVILGAGIFARPKPSSSVKQYSSVFRDSYDNVDSDPVTTVVTLPQSPTTRFVTHTETYTVTSTETTVLRSRGHPITRTVILTQTEAPRTVVSTIIGTITEIHTLDPSTITTTISATVTTREVEVTTTIYPPISPLDYNDFPAFTVRPADSLPPKRVDEFIEEVDRNPHGHDHDEELVRGVELENEVNRAVENNAADLPFSVDQPPSVPATCQPECDVNKSELCQERDGSLRCICRPGFARTFPDTPCTPTYTYRLKLLLDKEGPRRLRFIPTLSDASSPEFRRLSDATREGVMRAAMRSELRDMFHGAAVTGFEPKQKPKELIDLDQADDLMLNFYLQLSENMDESVLEEKFQRSLQSTNYSLGGTEVFAARETGIQAFDFDECGSSDFNDCSEHAQCFNLRGTYTCSCNEGYSDLSPSSKFPGRSCSAELLGCEQCNFHGTCYTLGRGDDKQYCDCFQWYAGDNCNINLKALLIALVTLGAVMLMLLFVCLILTCLKKRRNNKEGPGPGFMRYRGPGGAQVRGTLDKAAMLQDTSSESSGTTSPLPYMTPVHPSGSKGGRRGVNMDPSMVVHGEGSYVIEQDRSLTVMIPRAKYRPVPPASSVLSMSTFATPDAARTSGGGSPGNQSEQKLINYLETGPQEKQSSGGKRKQSSSSANHPENSRKTSAPRRPSAGALVSAGFEVSAQVTRPNARRASQGDHLTLASHRSGFTTLRTGDSDIERTPQSMEDLSPATIPIPPPPPPVTVSEARSYDETLVQPPTRSLVMRGAHLQPSSTYGSKLGSSRNDGQTMAERDIGSTFVMPQSQLYKPTRGQGSDVSNFDSL